MASSLSANFFPSPPAPMGIAPMIHTTIVMTTMILPAPVTNAHERRSVIFSMCSRRGTW